MYQFKGFVEIETLVSNVTNVISPIGELSSYCQTFAKDKTIFTDPTNRSTTVIGFFSKSTTTGVLEVPQNISTTALVISNWIYARQNSLVVNDTKDAFVSAYVTQFLTTCDELNCGELKVSRDGKLFPEWVTWKNRNYAVEDNLNKIWFSDDSFRHQYDEYEIKIIAPLLSIDYFFNVSDLVRKAISNRTYTETLNYVGLARGDYPETILSAEAFDWVNPFNPADTVSTNWTLLIHGPKGNDYDLIVTAIYDYILANSARTVAEWKTIFPDIFKRTEFILIPKWNNYAIPNLTLQAGIYSSIVNLSKELDYMKKILPTYPPEHINNHATVMPNPYKNVIMDVIGSFENKNNLFEITQLYPDIIGVSTTSNDYSRMTAATQKFIILLSFMLIAAEKMTSSSDVPIGFRRTIRDGVVYATSSLDKVQYLMACKSTTPDYV